MITAMALYGTKRTRISFADGIAVLMEKRDSLQEMVKYTISG